MPDSLEQYLQAATRKNTRRSYESAVRHFEIEWGGFLPATADAISRYLADYGGQLAFNTLKQRLAALAQWHVEQGFPDPTKAPVVRKVLKGIRTLHPAVEKQALPLQISQIEQIVNCLDNLILKARQSQDSPADLRHTRDKALLLIGFWRGFRGDELKRLQIEYIQLTPGQGLQCFLPQSKSDRQLQGRIFRVPALGRLCPVAAYEDWLTISGLTSGAVFRGIDRWGSISASALHQNSLIPLLRRLFTRAGLSMADEFSSHSLRRGFAGWATANGWDLKTLMEYVGWKDVKSAMRYIDGVDPFVQHGIETRRLSASRPSGQQE